MFQQLDYAREENLRSDNTHYHYIILDTDFTCGTSSKASSKTETLTWAQAPRVAAIVRAYQERKLPIAPNVARFYIWKHTTSGSFENDKVTKNNLLADAIWITKYHPELNYGQRILPCVLRQFKQLQYGRNYGIL